MQLIKQWLWRCCNYLCCFELCRTLIGCCSAYRVVHASKTCQPAALTFRGQTCTLIKRLDLKRPNQCNTSLSLTHTCIVRPMLRVTMTVLPAIVLLIDRHARDPSSWQVLSAPDASWSAEPTSAMPTLAGSPPLLASKRVESCRSQLSSLVRLYVWACGSCRAVTQSATTNHVDSKPAKITLAACSNSRLLKQTWWLWRSLVTHQQCSAHSAHD